MGYKMRAQRREPCVICGVEAFAFPGVPTTCHPCYNLMQTLIREPERTEKCIDYLKIDQPK